MVLMDLRDATVELRVAGLPVDMNVMALNRTIWRCVYVCVAPLAAGNIQNKIYDVSINTGILNTSWDPLVCMSK